MPPEPERGMNPSQEPSKTASPATRVPSSDLMAGLAQVGSVEGKGGEGGPGGDQGQHRSCRLELGKGFLQEMPGLSALCGYQVASDRPNTVTGSFPSSGLRKQ